MENNFGIIVSYKYVAKGPKEGKMYMCRFESTNAYLDWWNEKVKTNNEIKVIGIKAVEPNLLYSSYRWTKVEATV